MDNNQPTRLPTAEASSQTSTVPEVSTGSEPTRQPPAPLALKKKRHIWRWVGGIFAILVALAVSTAAGTYAWYQAQLQSPNPASTESVRVTVKQGDLGRDVAARLATQGLIKNSTAFEIYYRLHSTTGLKAGVYVLEKRMGVSEIVAHLEDGKPNEFALTFLPGATLSDAKKVLQEAGYDEQAIDKAFAARYDHPLLKGRPEGADLEGYIYGDTYNFYFGASLDEVLTKIFDHMYTDIQTNKLEEAYAKQGMSLYEGITFASVVQSEVSNKADMAHVSQVFHKRLQEDISLGSDVTFIYGARKLGVQPSVTLDSPYNTRMYKGLPPTPVSNPGLHALIAGANPTATNDLYFVAGDDGVTYFSATNEEHEQLTREHCAKNCLLPER